MLIVLTFIAFSACELLASWVCGLMCFLLLCDSCLLVVCFWVEWIVWFVMFGVVFFIIVIVIVNWCFYCVFCYYCCSGWLIFCLYFLASLNFHNFLYYYHCANNKNASFCCFLFMFLLSFSVIIYLGKWNMILCRIRNLMKRTERNALRKSKR